jgi:hypothetical protein
MKIAVLVMGMPRCLHEGAWWFHNRCTPFGDHYQMDFYVHTWDDNSLDLRQRIQQEWKTDNVQIDNFDDIFEDWWTPIERYNSIDGKGKYLEDHVLNWYKHGPHVGQFLSTGLASEMLFQSGMEYDFVIRTRFDTILCPIDKNKWMTLFVGIRGETRAEHAIFVPWLNFKCGLPYIGDLISVSTFKSWKNYAGKFNGKLRQLITKDKLKLSCLNGVPDHMTHVTWPFLGINSKTHFYPILGAMPVDFRVGLWRPEGYSRTVEESHFEEIKNHYAGDMVARAKGEI